MDVVVKGRHCTVSDAFRSHVEEKITRLEKLNDRVIRVEVEVTAERNKRQQNQATTVEITLRGKGPVVRAEAKAEDKYGAFETALDKLMAQLRRAADRKRVHHGNRTPQSLQEASAVLPADFDGNLEALMAAPTNGVEANGHHLVAGIDVDGDGPMVVREKTHQADPMTLDQALLEMELVGHDFFLFIDAEHRTPSVVYRRRAYDYGVIRLENAEVLAPTR